MVRAHAIDGAAAGHEVWKVKLGAPITKTHIQILEKWKLLEVVFGAYIEVILELYWDSGKENGNYYSPFLFFLAKQGHGEDLLSLEGFND